MPQWYQRLRAEIREQMSKQRGVIRYRNVWLMVCITVYLPRPKDTKFKFPPRGDVDNFAKALLDSVQRDKRDSAAMRYWLYEDDKWIQSLYVAKRWADANNEPGYVIEVEEMK